MKPPLRNTLTIRLGLVILLALLPAVFVAVLQYHDLHQALRSEASMRVHRMAEHIGDQGREDLVGARKLVTALARMPQVQAMDPVAVRPILRDLMRQSPAYNSCTLYNLKGEVVTTTVPNPPQVNVADRPWFQDVLASLGCTQGDHVIGRVINRPGLSLACPVFNAQGRLVGMVNIFMDYWWFQDITRGLDTHLLVSATIIDSRGTMLVRTPALYHITAKSIPNAENIMLGLKRGRDVIEDVGADGVRRIYAFSPLSLQPGRELYVRVGLPVEDVLAPAEANALRSILGLVAAALLGIFGAFVSARKIIIGPAREIVAATQRLGRGELSHRIASGDTGELADVAHAVDSMAASL
jgi:hypothetical protein